MNKREIQEQQYTFPYHYIPRVAPDGTPALSQRLAWGFEYLGYVGAVRAAVQDLHPRSVLEVGCGDGRVLAELNGIVAQRVGWDLSAAAIRFAQAFDPSATYHCRKAEDLDSLQCDVVLAVETLEHIPPEMVTAFLNAIWQRVRPGGHLLLTVPSDLRPVHAKHYQHFNPDTLRQQVEQALGKATCISAREICRDSRLINLWQRLFMNRRWWCEVAWLNRRMWHFYQTHCILPGSARGTHVIALFAKPCS